MSKFEKKLLKSGVKFSNAIVIGTGFGYLVDILNIFKTVFVFDNVRPDLKFRNLVYRENYLELGDFSDISMIFIDLSHLDKLSVLPPVMNRFQPPIAIEGNDVIGRDKSMVLYNNRYKVLEQQKIFHLWKLV